MSVHAMGAVGANSLAKPLITAALPLAKQRNPSFESA
jgi:hypothetical protein